jgi:putative Mn2+ efflux pump MntP
VLKLLALLLPLSLDTFAVATALGVAGIPRSQQLRLSLLLAGFEGGMPLLGVAIGRGVEHAIGPAAHYLASAALLALGAFVLFGPEDDDVDTSARFSRAGGVALVALGVSVSLDEVAIGLSAGLFRLPLAWTIVLIALQAFLAAQLGMRLGGRVGDRTRQQAHRIAGFALIGLGIVFIFGRVGGA